MKASHPPSNTAWHALVIVCTALPPWQSWQLPSQPAAGSRVNSHNLVSKVCTWWDWLNVAIIYQLSTSIPKHGVSVSQTSTCSILSQMYSGSSTSRSTSIHQTTPSHLLKSDQASWSQTKSTSHEVRLSLVKSDQVWWSLSWSHIKSREVRPNPSLMKSD